MCFIRDKWTKFEPTDKYLSTVKPLTSIVKLHNFIKIYIYIPEKGDYWKTPIEFLNDGGGDCDDFARFAVDVLVRIIGIKEARFLAYYSSKKGHAVCVFPYRGKYSVVSNKQLLHGFANYIDIGNYFFSKLKRMEIRDWQGKILSKKGWKIFGTF